MQQFSTRVLGSSESPASLGAESSSHELAGDDAKARPHVLFLIDHLMALGGGETNLLKVVQLMPPELVRCSVATFRIKPEIRQSISVPVYVFPWKRFFHLDAWRAAVALRRLIRTEKVDIVQTYFETSNLWGGLVAKLSGALLLSSRRDMGILRKTKHALVYRLVNRFSDRVLAVSEEVKRFCVDADRIDPNKVSVVYNGVDLKHVAAENSAGNSFADVGFGGRLAYRHMRSQHPESQRYRCINKDGTTCLPRAAQCRLCDCRQSLRTRLLGRNPGNDPLTGAGEKR